MGVGRGLRVGGWLRLRRRWRRGRLRRRLAWRHHIGWMVILDAGERLFDHLDRPRIAHILFADAPFLRLANAEPVQRGVGIGRQMVGVGGIDRLGIAGVLEDFGALDAAANGAGIERAFDPGIGMFLAGHDCLGEFLMRVAPAIDGADADVEMLGELFVGGAEAAHLAGYGCKFWFVDHGAVNSAGGVGVESRWGWAKCQ